MPTTSASESCCAAPQIPTAPEERRATASSTGSGQSSPDDRWPIARERYARSLEKAYVLATEVAEERRERAAGTFVEYHTDVCFGDVVARWLDAPHLRWGEQYPDKVRSLLKNWVLAGDITVNWPSRSTGAPLAKVPIGAITADHYNQAFEHVRTARAHRTYTEGEACGLGACILAVIASVHPSVRPSGA